MRLPIEATHRPRKSIKFSANRRASKGVRQSWVLKADRTNVARATEAIELGVKTPV